MSVKIRLARGGTKNHPFHKIVVANSRAPRDGDFIERIGSYNPMLPTDHSHRVVLDVERAKYWISKGAQPSERLAKILADLGAMTKPEIRKTTKAHLPKAKAQERMRVEEEAKVKAAEDAAAAKAAAKAEAEAAKAAALAPAAEEAPVEAPAAE